jgi:hypothetical protein
VTSLPTARSAALLASTALAGLTSMAVVAAPTSAAVPAAVVHTQGDTVADVWLQGETSDLWSEHGARRNVDLTASRVRHAPRMITTTGWFTDLVRAEDRTSTVFWILTSAGRTYRVQHTAGPSRRSGQVFFKQYVDGRLHGRSCPGLTNQVSYADDLMRVVIPRPCLGRPAWVRFHGVAVAFDEESGARYSDAMMDSGPDNQLYSPRIVRDDPPRG